MRILLCNDDGIYAPGILHLYEAAKNLGDIDIVAPVTEQSAVGHAITISDPLKARRVTREGGFTGHAVGGTPADCVKLAVSSDLLDQKPDLVLSGINLGPNPAINVIYSGTVSAATEATILGIPGMAISMNTFTDPHWDSAVLAVHHLVPMLMERGLPADTFLNVNVPNIAPADLKGYKLTRMGRSRFFERFHKRSDPRGNDYYWLDGDMTLLDHDGGTDVEALQEGYVSITPIGLDLTQYSALETLEEWGL